MTMRDDHPTDDQDDLFDDIDFDEGDDEYESHWWDNAILVYCLASMAVGFVAEIWLAVKLVQWLLK